MRQKITGGKLFLSRTQKRRTQALVVRLLLIAGLLILWEFMVRSGRLSSFYTSYPSEIAADLWEFYTSGDLYKHASITLREAFTGLFYGTIIGVAVGVVFVPIYIFGACFKADHHRYLRHPPADVGAGIHPMVRHRPAI